MHTQLNRKALQMLRAVLNSNPNSDTKHSYERHVFVFTQTDTDTTPWLLATDRYSLVLITPDNVSLEDIQSRAKELPTHFVHVEDLKRWEKDLAPTVSRTTDVSQYVTTDQPSMPFLKLFAPPTQPQTQTQTQTTEGGLSYVTLPILARFAKLFETHLKTGPLHEDAPMSPTLNRHSSGQLPYTVWLLTVPFKWYV